MARFQIKLLLEMEIQEVHEASLRILARTGVLVHHADLLQRLGEAGASLDPSQHIARFPETLVQDCLSRAGKQYILYGRDRKAVARFGYGDLVLMSSPGQFNWIDGQSGRARPATIQDMREAIRLGNALANITIVGSMGQPAEIDARYREVFLTAELIKGTTKPTRTWVYNGRTARYVLELYRTVAGGEAALRQHPMTEAFLEPISPLQLPRDGLEVVMEFVRAGQPVSIGPMAMASGTAPATLAGTLAQENAEILAGLVITQILAPGTPVTYGGIPHILDPRTSLCSFGSPEQALMAVAMVQMGHFYGLPVYINVGLTDAKQLDAQAGLEKGSTLVLGALAGADMFGHAGICGADHGASLAWLMIDHELMAYVKRLARGCEVTKSALAVELVNAVGCGGTFMAEPHTVEQFRREFWLPSAIWTRQPWGIWENAGRASMEERARVEVQRLLATQNAPPVEDALARELDRIVSCAQRELT